MYFSLIVVSEVSVLSVCVELVFDSDFLEWLETKERVEKREGKSDRENHSKQRKKKSFCSLYRWALCWNIPSMLNSGFILNFWPSLSLGISQNLGIFLGSSGAFSEHVPCLRYTYGFLKASVYMGNFEYTDFPKNLFPWAFGALLYPSSITFLLRWLQAVHSPCVFWECPSLFCPW